MEPTPYDSIFQLNYDAVRFESEPDRPSLFFIPLKQLKHITKDTPLPPEVTKLHIPRSAAKHAGEVVQKRAGQGSTRERTPSANSTVSSAPSSEDYLSAKKTNGNSIRAVITAKCIRLTIPVSFMPDSNEYYVPPDTPVKSFTDIEWWLIQFYGKFHLTADKSTFRSAGSSSFQPPAKAHKRAQDLPRHVVGLNVQAFENFEQAQSFFTVFAPPGVNPEWIKSFLDGLEGIFKGDTWCDMTTWLSGKRKSGAVDGEAEVIRYPLRRVMTEMATLQGLGYESGVLQGLWEWANRKCVDLTLQGEQFMAMTFILRDRRPDHCLVHRRAEVPSDSCAEPVMFQAIRKQNHLLVHLLLLRGADLMCRGEDLKTCIHIAARLGDVTALRLLLSGRRPFDVDALDGKMQTPLMEAAFALSLECVELLLSQGANAAHRDGLNDTPLHSVVRGGFNQAVAELLISHGCPTVQGVNNKREAADTLAARIPAPYRIDLPTKKYVFLDIMHLHSDTIFSTPKQRHSQGTLRIDISEVSRRPLFEYSFDLAIHPSSECFIQLTPCHSVHWPTPYCACKGPCNRRTCNCIKMANRGSTVFDIQGRLLLNFPQAQPIVVCPAHCTCSADCPLRTLRNAVTPPMEIFQSGGVWMTRTMVDLERGQFVTFLGGELIHPRYAVKDKTHRYLMFSRGLMVDVSRKANGSRFFQDSLEANLRTVMVREFDYRKPPQVAFFAQEWIAKGEVLSYDKTKCFEANQCALREYCFTGFKFIDTDVMQ